VDGCGQSSAHGREVVEKAKDIKKIRLPGRVWTYEKDALGKTNVDAGEIPPVP
jgi:hypothetical protein